MGFAPAPPPPPAQPSKMPSDLQVLPPPPSLSPFPSSLLTPFTSLPSPPPPPLLPLPAFSPLPIPAPPFSPSRPLITLPTLPTPPPSPLPNSPLPLPRPPSLPSYKGQISDIKNSIATGAINNSHVGISETEQQARQLIIIFSSSAVSKYLGEGVGGGIWLLKGNAMHCG